ncbi:fatty acid desaturase CarF family protein [Hyphomonas jannaschiana]|uniref:fatty acid desaturase CarF family protein n=1 Tax=Hyphomonas jannaschiana TaxID=86 RepID=UPI0035C713B4
MAFEAAFEILEPSGVVQAIMQAVDGTLAAVQPGAVATLGLLGTGALIAGQALAGWLLADLGSGVIHWAQDRYGSPRWPLVGGIVRDTIRHHRKPMGFLDKPVLARSARMIGLALVVLMALLLAGAPLAFALPLSAGIFLSNEIHAAAHAKARSLPGPVRALQRIGLIQSPLHHAAHHRHLKNVNFCTLTDWVNPVLERARFWRRLEAVIRYAGGIRTRRDPVVRRQQRRRWKAA